MGGGARSIVSRTRMGITGLHHVGISTPDLGRLVAFYRDMFGFEVEASMEWAGEPDWEIPAFLRNKE